MTRLFYYIRIEMATINFAFPKKTTFTSLDFMV